MTASSRVNPSLVATSISSECKCSSVIDTDGIVGFSSQNTMQLVKRITVLLTIIYVCANCGYAQTNNSCGLEKFQCHNGQCIESDLLCDGIIHCNDQSDETETECRRSEIFCPDYAFRCDYGACVNKDSVCNGIQECADNSDETQQQCNTTGPNNQTEPCKIDEFTCNNGRCISRTSLCDGMQNCIDGSDEVFAICRSISCTATAFRCNYGACIDGDLRCNGIANCADGSDEDVTICNVSLNPITNVTSKPVTPTFNENCKAPPQPKNGQWKLYQSQCPNNENCDVAEGEELQLGSRIVYSCNPGYRLRGSADVSCALQGEWITIPVCTEIRCKGLTTSSVQANCLYNDEWVACETPVLPRTTARLMCKNSYRLDTTRLSTRRKNVRCDENGQWVPEPIQCIPACGVPPANVTPLIINGTRPKINEFPWHASLYYDEAKTFFCGSSIITENLLITAAHCVFDESTREVRNASLIYVATGNIYRDYDYPDHNRFIPDLVQKNQVKNIYIACNYLGYEGNYLWDIAILQLEKSFKFSSWLVPVCIDVSNDQGILQAGMYGKVAGFGRTASGESSAILQSLKVPYIPPNECKYASQSVNAQRYITIDKFCAGFTNGSSVCDGDSGGGLVFETNGQWYLRGIVSVSLGTSSESGDVSCNRNLYSLYTEVSNHMAWIQDVMLSIERKFVRPPCSNG